MPSFSDWLFGSPDKLKKVPTGNPEQQNLHSNILSQAMGMQQPGGGYDLAQNFFNSFLGGNQQQAFDQFSAPYLQQFQEKMLPQIAERFAGAGALSSSGFGQALGGASSDLQSQLAQLFAQLQSQAAGQQYNQYNQLSQLGLNYQPFAYNKQQGSSGFLNNLLGGVANPFSPAFGNNIASGINSLFKSPQGGGIA